MERLIRRRRTARRLREIRSSQPSRSSAEAYAQMERMRASEKASTLVINGDSCKGGLALQG